MIVVWHGRDLRLEDHPALVAAVKSGEPLLPVYIDEEGEGAATRWWLERSLRDLQGRYRELGAHLVVRKGDPQEIFDELQPKAVYWIRRGGDDKIARALEAKGIECHLFEGNYLLAADHFSKPYLVYTPYAKAALREQCWGAPLPAPKRVEAAPKCRSERLEGSDLDFDWEPGRAGALKLLKRFRTVEEQYAKSRDYPGTAGTSRLSPHLAFGEISVREVWRATSDETFHKELLWRDFARQWLHYFPEVEDRSWREEFERYPWEDRPDWLEQWKRGETGVPIVDAGMRQLLETGWMHNRVRMIVASYLVKDLRIHWIEGARWFWERLVDADLANNSLGWQWVAGCGPDAAPYFRVFNPTLQGKKFDEHGLYVRRYLPDLPEENVHEPWKEGWPEPMVDHAEARRLALAGYEKVKS